ncbi:hypothetical protein AURANDRAFT_59872 [Aureococcus anophagefferens]|uniref:NADP-dependent oxidoreductase domain-containing protein n=1 Tax=Aureococcus anophagefferens TaxID=44056 RepID=F0Y0Z9_AURAN|nr:hypothetical protein AURANDRAFT_59872 [Aureococcus anophagefferens]EGB11652.1 hypothetical protein AURANDRAFT_59872 [Aureococcus anophagefferens]|eukprot:XP_009033997.1 hypothetical protein AURANDRAFT_59872 [Aureococcus anophagefferens]
MAPQTGSIVLNNGDSMPIIGLGTWQAPKGEVGAAVRVAIENGYRHVDCAACYGNEAEIGEVFADLFARGVVKREELFVTSKLWNSEHAPKDVRPACEKTLKDLRLDYLDLYLIHWPQNFAKEVEGNCSFPRNDDGSMRYDVETTSAETWSAMEALVDAKLCKAIGLSNFNSKQIEDLLTTCRIKPANLQVEVHPYFSQAPLAGFCHAKGISLTAYSPLGTGATIDGMTVVGNPVLAAIGEAHGKSAAQVAIAWLAQRGLVVIPKSVTAARVVANRDVDFALTPEDMAKVDGLNKDFRNGWGGPKVNRDGAEQPRDGLHPLYPFTQPGVAF